MLKYFVELFGTFLFLSVIFSVGQPIPIAAALLAAILFGGKVSNHFNPAVSFTAWTRGSLTGGDLILYILAQLIGGILASMYTNMTK